MDKGTLAKEAAKRLTQNGGIRYAEFFEEYAKGDWEYSEMLASEIENLTQQSESKFHFDYMQETSNTHITNRIIRADTFNSSEKELSMMGKLLFSNCIFTGDFSQYNFSALVIKDSFFTRDSKLPKDSRFFKKTLCLEIGGCLLPPFDFSMYDFNMYKAQKKDVLPSLEGSPMAFRNTIFSYGTKYPNEKRQIDDRQNDNQSQLDTNTQPHSYVTFKKCIFHGFRFDLGFPKKEGQSICFIFPVFPPDIQIPNKCIGFDEAMLGNDRWEIASPLFPAIDFSHFDFCGANLSGIKFHRDTILPIHNQFFKQLKPMLYLNGLTLPSYDYSSCDFVDTSLEGICFTEDSRLPYDTELFQKLSRKSLYMTRLPAMDFSEFNFSNIDIARLHFARDAKLPSDRDFFSKIASHSIAYTTLPYGDYTQYNFKGINISGTNFTLDSRIPLDILDTAEYDDRLRFSRFPDHFVEEVLVFNKPSCGMNLSDNHVSETAKVLLRAKCRYDTSVIFPKDMKKGA